MRFVLPSAIVGCAMIVAVVFPRHRESLAEARAPEPISRQASPEKANVVLDRAPVAFVPDLGQWGNGARFVARFGALTVALQERGWWVDVAQGRGPVEAAVPRVVPVAVPRS